MSLSDELVLRQGALATVNTNSGSADVLRGFLESFSGGGVDVWWKKE
ncbi:MAG: hypothetical protein Q4C03_04890 [bacterium]|nr:hypothetical protein [bacterium]